MHHWIWKHWGKPMKCEECSTTRKDTIYDWSNNDHKYIRDRKQWRRLCRACHKTHNKLLRSKLGKGSTTNVGEQ